MNKDTVENKDVIEWIDWHANRLGLNLEEVRVRTSITPRRWHRIRINRGTTKEEVEEIATEAFGLFPGEAWNSPHYQLATRFRNYLASKGREEYCFPRLWQQVLKNMAYRTNDSFDAFAIDVFEEVFEADNDPTNW